MESEIKILESTSTTVDYIRDIISHKEDDDSFYILDLGTILDQYALWKEHFPKVQPFYAVKCNDTRLILETLSSIGVSFDCASKEEIRKALKAGGKPDGIIYANPLKSINHLKYAKEQNVSLMTFDSSCELHKVKKYFPRARLVLRIKVDATEGSCLVSFGDKFGADPKREAFDLLDEAARLGLRVHGVSFHVGTGCTEPQAYRRAIRAASKIFTRARELGFYMEYLDIGGGFPGNSPLVFSQIADIVNKTLEEEEESFEGTKIIAEPGRFFGCKSLTLVTSVISLRETPVQNEYYINNGVFTSFNAVLTESLKPQPIPLDVKYDNLKKSIIWGQTMKECDKIVDDCLIPKLETGDWLYFTSIGAYSSCVTSCNFYGYEPPLIYPVIRRQQWEQLKENINSKNRNRRHN